MTDETIQHSPQDWLKSVLGHLGIKADVVQSPPELAEKFKAFGGTWLTIKPNGLSEEASARLLGEKGSNLDALQYLVNATMNLENDPDSPPKHTYTLELNGYRESHYSRLMDLAYDASERVRASQEELEMPPLTAAERRLIHTILVDEDDLETFSRGQDRDRRLVVRPVQE